MSKKSRKRKVVIVIIVIITVIGLFVTYTITRKPVQQGLSGAAKKLRPPKIRIVYSRKLSSESAIEILRDTWSSGIQAFEEFLILMLDPANRVLGYHVLSKGGISGTVADIRLLFSVALKSLASKIVIAHNHPSGRLVPSEKDVQLTQEIKRAGDLMNIPLIDHIIITKEGYYSFADEGVL